MSFKPVPLGKGLTDENATLDMYHGDGVREGVAFLQRVAESIPVSLMRVHSPGVVSKLRDLPPSEVTENRVLPGITALMVAYSVDGQTCVVIVAHTPLNTQLRLQKEKRYDQARKERR